MDYSSQPMNTSKPNGVLLMLPPVPVKQAGGKDGADSQETVEKKVKKEDTDLVLIILDHLHNCA